MLTISIIYLVKMGKYNYTFSDIYIAFFLWVSLWTLRLVGVEKLSPQTSHILSQFTGRVVERRRGWGWEWSSTFPLQNFSWLLTACIVLNSELHLLHFLSGNSGREASVVDCCSCTEDATIVCSALQWRWCGASPLFLNSLPQLLQGSICKKYSIH